jgi:hypothetical protein
MLFPKVLLNLQNQTILLQKFTIKKIVSYKYSRYYFNFLLCFEELFEEMDFQHTIWVIF